MIHVLHGTISWAENAEPPFPGKVHIILEADDRDHCRIACGSDNWAIGEWCYDEVDGPVTCKSCLKVKPETIERMKAEMEAWYDY